MNLHATWCHTLSGLISTLSPLNNTFEYSSRIGMTHPFVRLKRCLTSYIAGFMVLSWSALNPCTCLIFSRIHRKKALENYHQSSIDNRRVGEVDDTRSPLPGASIPNVTLSQPCPVCFYLWNWDMWGGAFNFPRKHADVRIIEILLYGLYVT